MNYNRIVGIGETVYDIIFKNGKPVSATPGGSTFNSLISLGRMRVNTTMLTDTGSDIIGNNICAFMRDNGVDTSFVNRTPDTKSHLSLAFLNEYNDAQYQFYKDHEGMSMPKLVPEIKSDDIVLFGSFFAINPIIRPIVGSVIKEASQRGAFIYYDVNFRASHIDDIPRVLANVEENMRLATIVRGSLEDFGYLYGIDTNAPEAVERIYREHITPFCHNFICTDGGKPIKLLTPALRLSFDNPKIETVSTIGAGDNFNAGFLYALYHNPSLISADDWKEKILSGQHFSSTVCQLYDNYVPRNFQP